ncbi:MAG: 1-deoxy-D-xylulose-5-phosphate reductoisomerase [Hyphomicrobiaceae bacterium]
MDSAPEVAPLVLEPEGWPRRISVLGATGSVGTNTLDLIARHGDAFDVDVLTAQTNVAALAELALKHRARLAVIGAEEGYAELKARLAGSGIEAAAGSAALIEAASRPVDCVMAAIVGAAGLRPTFAAARAARRVALANKECLVSAGTVFMSAIEASGTELLPVDSEHSAALQAIGSHDPKFIERIVLTASGGPFRTWSEEQLATVTPEQAVRHPNWSMGRKITVDSATLMNKCLELIEAYHLFPVEADQLAVVVHPQSIVHCLVEFADGSVIAQMANPDMRTPIALSLAWPARMAAPTPRLDLVRLGALTFEAPDERRFPALSLARRTIELGGTAGAILNAANEVAVEAFLARQMPFPAVAALAGAALEEAVRQGQVCAPAGLDDVIAADEEGRALARRLLQRYS